jgi:triphosphoribosyl-dephospho-CoA synthetase
MVILPLSGCSENAPGLIARKNGIETARKVSGRAGQVLKYGGVFSEKGKAEIKRFDLDLRDKGHTLNP